MAGIKGKFMNHSLRATSASRMYQSSVSEQVIKEITGHRSDCVRIYKKTSRKLLEDASKMIAGCSSENCEKESGNVDKKSKGNSKVPLESHVTAEQKSQLNFSMSICEMIKNVVKTRMEMRNKKAKKGVVCMNKVARRIVKKQKK